MKISPNPPPRSYDLVWTVMIAMSLCIFSGCGGSSSETPWPREPEGRHLGPAGEGLPKGNVVDVKALPVDKRYEKSGDDGKPNKTSP